MTEPQKETKRRAKRRELLKRSPKQALEDFRRDSPVELIMLQKRDAANLYFSKHRRMPTERELMAFMAAGRWNVDC